MRRLVLILLSIGLGAPAAAIATQQLPGDGTLVVDNARGVIALKVSGGVIGRLDQGTIEVTDPIAGDGLTPRVIGWQQRRVIGPRHIQYSGEGDIRFRMIGGLYRIRIDGVGIDVSVVGKGSVLLDGSEFSSDQPGRFQLNGDAYQPMPDTPTRFVLGPAPLPAGEKGSDKGSTKTSGSAVQHGQ